MYCPHNLGLFRIRKRIYDADGESYEPQELLDAYLRFGGMPGIADVAWIPIRR